MRWNKWVDWMQPQPELTQSNQHNPYQQIMHILVAGLWTSDKHKFIHHISEAPLEEVDVAANLIPVELPKLLMGELQVDSRLITRVWGAPDHWRHDYVNYLVNIKSILNNRGDHHRVMGMIVVVDSVVTASSENEGKLLRLIQSDWSLPYIVVASHPYNPYARSVDTIREQYHIQEDIPILPYDISNPSTCKQVLIDLMYRIM